MGTAGPNPALNALLATSAAAQGAAALGASQAATSSQPPSPTDAQTRYSDSAARTAMIGVEQHSPSAQPLQSRVKLFGETQGEPSSRTHIPHPRDTSTLSATLMLAGQGSTELSSDLSSELSRVGSDFMHLGGLIIESYRDAFTAFDNFAQGVLHPDITFTELLFYTIGTLPLLQVFLLVFLIRIEPAAKKVFSIFKRGSAPKKID